jgi:hypothetical protein
VWDEIPWDPSWVRYRIPPPVLDESLAAGLDLPGTVPARQVAFGFGLIRHHYGLDVAALPRRLVWAGRVEGWDVAVVAVTAPSGAQVLAVLQWDPAVGGPVPGSIESWSGETAVLPAGALDRTAIAWSGDSKEEAGHPFHVFVLVPPGSAAVRVDDAGVVARTRVDGARVVSVRHEPQREGFEGARVRVLDAAGRTIAVTGVNTRLSSDPMPPRPGDALGTP